MGRVTVGIPVFNMAQFIGQVLESLKAQTLQDFEIIVCDDASTDNLAQVLESYAGWPNLRLLKMESNMGIRHVLNAMIANCDTEFFVSLAADDLLEPTYLERALKEFENDKWLEFVASQTDFIDAHGKTLAPLAHHVQPI